MASITKGKTFTATELVTADSLHKLVDDASIANIVDADVSATAAIASSKLDLTAYDTTIKSYISGTNPTNLLSNGDFEAWSAGTSAVPDGWALELTPTVGRDTGDVGYGSYSCKVTGNGAALEGIKFTTGTLKPSTSYTLSVRVKATAGDTATIVTTGATTNLALESTSATFTLVTGTLVTDASGTAVVIKLLAKADTDIVWFDGAMLVEGSSAFAFSDKPAGLLKGTYVPTFTCSTSGSVTPNTSFDTLGFSVIGNMCYVHGTVIIATVSSPVGDLRMSLPIPIFAGSERSHTAAGMVTAAGLGSALNQLVIYINASGVCSIAEFTGTTMAYDAAAHIANDTELYFSFFYPVA